MPPYGSYSTCLTDLYTNTSNASDAHNVATLTANTLLQCVVAAANACASQMDTTLNVFFLLYVSSLVFFMQTAFVMVCAGCV